MQAGKNINASYKRDTFTLNNVSLEFFSLNEGFTVAVEIENREIISYYCNIAMPSVFKNNHLSFVDLDLDLVKRKHDDWEVVDEDEFEINSSIYNYPPELKESANQSLEELKRRINRREFPFDGTLLDIYNYWLVKNSSSAK